MKKTEKRCFPGQPGQSEPQPETQVQEKEKKCVLVIEDCDTDRTFIRIVLRHFGFKVIEVPHSKDFFPAMWRNAENIFMILFDGHVPDFNPDSSVVVPYVVDFYRNAPSEMRPVLISTTTDEKVKEKHLKSGCLCHVDKANIVDDLTKLCSSLIPMH